LPDSKLDRGHRPILEKVLRHIDSNMATSHRRLFELLKIPSIGTDPDHAADCRLAAEWLMNEFKSLGFASVVMPTSGNPVVIARNEPKTVRAPHVLFYGHYDVQPSEPDGLWDSPPFSPVIRKNRKGGDIIVARGAADDKGQVMTFVEACRAWLKIHGSLPFKLTLLIEGDEEGESSHIDRFIAKNRKTLRADIALICDTGLWDERTPCIATMLRGCIAEEVFVHGPRIDLHSGYFGGPAINPIRALSKVIASLHGKDGRVTIPGFYDGVKPVSAKARRDLKAIPFKEKAFMREAGLTHAAGERGYSVLEQVWLRPTCELNGIFGGYAQEGSKTVLPAQASAKITFRLVQGQNPSAIRRAFHRHVRKHLPPDCRATFESGGGNSSGASVSSDSPWIGMAKDVLKQEWGKAPVIAGIGGSIPVVESFKNHLGIDSLLIGFGLDDDKVHSPNEKYDVRSYHKGTRTWARLFHEIQNKGVK
jgi:acetylornithine deacetylase/succinyl-diaminopimelate desuccinylase-like protein